MRLNADTIDKAGKAQDAVKASAKRELSAVCRFLSPARDAGAATMIGQWSRNQTWRYAGPDDEVFTALTQFYDVVADRLGDGCTGENVRARWEYLVRLANADGGKVVKGKGKVASGATKVRAYLKKHFGTLSPADQHAIIGEISVTYRAARAAAEAAARVKAARAAKNASKVSAATGTDG